MVEKKLFLLIQSINIMSSQLGEYDCSAHKKRMEIIMCIKVCLISRMNFDYKVYGEKNSFSCKSDASISCIPKGEHDYNTHNKKNEDYYKYPSLSYFKHKH